jgi:hypothetical protein
VSLSPSQKHLPTEIAINTKDLKAKQYLTLSFDYLLMDQNTINLTKQALIDKKLIEEKERIDN